MKQRYKPPIPGPDVRPDGSGGRSNPITQRLRACEIARTDVTREASDDDSSINDASIK